MKAKLNYNPYFVIMFLGLLLQFLIGLFGFNSVVEVRIIQ